MIDAEDEGTAGISILNNKLAAQRRGHGKLIAEQGQPGQFGMRDGGKVAGVRARSCIKLFFPTTTPSSIIRLRLIIDKSLASVSPGMQNPVEPAKSSRRGRLGCP